MFRLFKDELLADNVKPEQIISINFEELEYEHLRDYHALYQYILERMQPNETNYIFLDEIQHVDQFHRVVDSLFVKENTDLYITGSNAYFMSSDIATLLTGRYVEIQMLPLSFSEFYPVSYTHLDVYKRHALHDLMVEQPFCIPYSLPHIHPCMY